MMNKTSKNISLQKAALDDTAAALKSITDQYNCADSSEPKNEVYLAMKDTEEALVYLAIAASDDDPQTTNDILRNYGREDLFPSGEIHRK